MSSLREVIGSLDLVARVVNLTVFVRCGPDFDAHPAVADGAAEVFSEVFGSDAGAPARAAIGVTSLPFGIPVELTLVASSKR